MLLCGRGAGQPPTPPGHWRLAPPSVYTQGLHVRLHRPCVSLQVALSAFPSASVHQGTRSHFRLAPIAVAVVPSPTPGYPRPTWVPPALSRLPLVACSCLSSSPPGAFSKPLRGIASPGALAAPGVCRLRTFGGLNSKPANYRQVTSNLKVSFPTPTALAQARGRAPGVLIHHLILGKQKTKNPS